MVLDLLREASAALPDDPNAIITLGHQKTRAGALGEALAIWEEVRATRPDDLSGWVWSALCLREMRAFAAAESRLQEALTNFPGRAEVLFDRARLAQIRGDWKAALERWRIAAAATPDRAEGYIGEALSLRELGDFTGARAILDRTRRRFPDDRFVLTELARLASRDGAWEEADSAWRAVRARYPDEPLGFSGGAAALRALQRPDEAEALLRPAVNLFADNLGCWLEYALALWECGEVAEALQTATQIRDRFPREPSGYVFAVQWLVGQERYVEAEELLASAESILPGHQAIMVERARVAEARRDWPAAQNLWRAVRDASPDNPQAFQHESIALRRQGRHADAVAVLQEGMARSSSPELLAEAGWGLLEAGDPEQAAVVFSECRQRYPTRRDGHIGLAQSLLDQQLTAEADEAFRVGMEALPQDPEVMVRYALAPQFHGGPPGTEPWNRSLERLTELRDRFPHYARGFIETLRCLRLCGRLQEAERLGRIAVERFPRAIDVAEEQAVISLERKDWAEAEARFLRMRSLFSGSPVGAMGLAKAWAGTGRMEEAEQEVRSALERWPSDRNLLITNAELAMQRADWDEGVRRWEFALRHHPHDRWVKDGLFGARVAAGMEPEPSAKNAEDYRDLMLNFASFAGTPRGCEFGLIQRHFGADPLGLLRWSNIHPDKLADALECRFEGVGRPENTELFVLRDTSREYMVRDRRFGMVMHTFVPESRVKFDAMYKQMISRSVYLARKLIEDLTEGQKIFVYRLPDRALNITELRQIRSAMATYGDNVLLYVRLADAEHPPGSALWAAPGLMIGFIDRFEQAPDGTTGAPNFAGWLAVCQAAYRLWQARPAIAPKGQAREAALA